MSEKLVPVSIAHVHELMTWFADKQELSQWSGPGFEYPYDGDSFIRDLKMDRTPSYALLSTTEEVLAFGQYYNRLNRCHLGRLVVSPQHRGQGFAKKLMSSLIKIGCDDLGVMGSSLFVLSYNHSAIRAYEKAGFIIVPYPELIPLDDCLYMICDKTKS